MSFNAKALYAALDKQRAARGMTWNDVADALRVSASTIRELPDQKVIETDGVLQMTRWLGLNIESFVGEGRDATPGPDPGDWKSTGRILRFDTRALYDALDERRRTADISWQKLSEEIGNQRATAVMLLGLKKSSRVELNTLLAILKWLGVRTTRFTRLTTT